MKYKLERSEAERLLRANPVSRNALFRVYPARTPLRRCRAAECRRHEAPLSCENEVVEGAEGARDNRSFHTGGGGLKVLCMNCMKGQRSRTGQGHGGKF